MKRVLISLVLVVVVMASLSLSPLVPAAQAAEIKVGVLMPLTGYIAFFGKMQEAALRLAQKEFAKAGPSGGFDLKFVIYDTGSKPQDAILMAQKLMHTDKVHLIVGPFLSTECEQVFPIVNRDKVPIVTGSSAKPGLTAASRPWTFRNIMTSDKINEPTIKAWVQQKNIKTVAILTDIKSRVSESYGKGVAPTFLKKYGVQIVEDINFVTEDIDFSAQVTKVKAANPDGIVLAGEYAPSANIAREVRKQGMKQPFLADVPTVSPEFVKLGGEAVEGTYAPTDFWAGNPDPKVQDFVKKFKQEYGQDKDPHTTTGCFYDALYVTRFIVGKAGLSGKPADLQKDREKIRDGWASLKDFAGDATGKTTIDKDGDAWKAFYTLTVKSGQWVKAP
ncbi:MAG: branched-chain amino acid abc transporter, amino acid-binding protein [Deltaproteobacteria bacterium]|jgi:branched-chain amino acid transport system substrate-binding protein|nr:branched-chain amino acid abc transporter, amino acid-binding protein [Deltaproteobacteria bacterium]